MGTGRMSADVPDHLWEGYNFGCPTVINRLDQGPFGITQDDGWFTIFVMQPSRNHVRNFGTGLVGYTWEENGPALTVQPVRMIIPPKLAARWN